VEHVLTEHDAYILMSDLIALVEDGHEVTLMKEELGPPHYDVRRTQYTVQVNDLYYSAEDLRIAIMRVFHTSRSYFPEDHYPFQLPKDQAHDYFDWDDYWDQGDDDDTRS
jgi:hypothetical protein